ncbi:MAG: hypothetical protein WCP28_17605, partial [Actinomycetes bacterium]
QSPSRPTPDTSADSQPTPQPDGPPLIMLDSLAVYYGTTWPGWKPTSISVISPAASVLKQFTFVNVFDPTQTYLVLAGSDDTSVPGSGPTPTYRPTPTPTYTTATPTPTRTSPSPSPTSGSPTQSPTTAKPSGSTTRKPSAPPPSYGLN